MIDSGEFEPSVVQIHVFTNMCHNIIIHGMVLLDNSKCNQTGITAEHHITSEAQEWVSGKCLHDEQVTSLLEQKFYCHR